MADFYLKQGNTLPSFKWSLLNPDGTIPNLTGASVIFRMGRPDTGDKVVAAAAVIDAIGGIVQYNWLAQDTNTPGTYNAEWQVTFPAGGGLLSYPNQGYLTVEVSPPA